MAVEFVVKFKLIWKTSVISTSESMVQSRSESTVESRSESTVESRSESMVGSRTSVWLRSYVTSTRDGECS